MSRRLGSAVLVATVTLALAACTDVVGGKAVSVFDNPFNVGGLPVTDGPSGLRSTAPQASREADNSDGGQDDNIAVQSISDIEEFWQQAYRDPLPGTFEPVKSLVSWDANGRNYQFCGEDTFATVNAGFCPLDDTIGWDRGELLPGLRNGFGDMAITMVLAHEYGHSIQRQANLITDQTPILVAEQQADCLAGVYMRWVAEDNSPRFSLSTGAGLNNLLAAMISFRDPLLSIYDADMGVDEHGSAFERISAFQFGFTDGIQACVSVDEAEVAQRRGDLPVALQVDQTGEWPVTEESVKGMLEALNIVFKPAQAPQLTFDAAACPDARPNPPVSYCPSTNTIVVDLPALQEMGTQREGDDALSFGDNTAYSVLTSRFMLALQQQHGGLALDSAEAALRTACLTGVATTKLSNRITIADGNTIALTAGDVDEAVSGMLTNGLAASDVNGETVPSGFSRIDAFRTGVLGDQDRCLKRYP